MLARFGIFLGWLFNAAALVCAAPAVLMYFNLHGRMSDDRVYMAWFFVIIAGAVWLLGRGLRYVFVGPTYVSHAKEFVERFADPNAPLRLPASHPPGRAPASDGSPSGPWGPR
ncbi:hypothetical protein ABIF65_010977 [Bradyrhizobium japonicum]|nr:hypothetical protein [Bradyrhizobium japonicum]MCP1776690.1 hypothetical protein [Bradyrhizobium japonicum]MCP1856222.1 hypothetical protein [Bradyrhizobium japonicum]MCP1896969.1 hypothetical protein [Bradyrhizobium japonicum]MCP1960309.1 hypothetical protein [Bradyrhizobium japonicum]